MRYCNLTFALFGCFGCLACLGADKTWTAGAGDWFQAANWNPVGVPAATDHAIINSGSPAVNSNIQIDRLTLDGGSLEGGGTISVTNFLWKSGSMGGSGTMEIPVGGSAMIDGPEAKTLNRVFRNEGTVKWTGAGPLGPHGAGGTFSNLAGGVF